MDRERHLDRVVVVTGAASGIGRQACLRFAGEGGTVIANDKDGAGLAETAAAADGKTPVTTVVGDVREQTVIDEIVATALDTGGGIHVLANIAGIMDHFVPVDAVDDALWADVLAVNLTAPMRLCRAVVPHMRDHGGGSIVNVSSEAGIGGSGAGAAYHASKHGIIGLTRHIAFVYRPVGIRCNAVCPGGTNTNIGTSSTPTVEWAYERQLTAITLNERMAEPEEIAAVISWLGCTEASNVNGSVVMADGGWSVA
ncbi:MAG: SDR family NAD(P)-dependent oxidoreductase [Ilumatobacteraceae bacterium]